MGRDVVDDDRTPAMGNGLILDPHHDSMMRNGSIIQNSGRRVDPSDFLDESLKDGCDRPDAFTMTGREFGGGGELYVGRETRR